MILVLICIYEKKNKTKTNSCQIFNQGNFELLIPAVPFGFKEQVLKLPMNKMRKFSLKVARNGLDILVFGVLSQLHQ